MILVADNFQITHPIVRSALASGDPGQLNEWVRRIEAADARMMDLNTGPLGKGAAQKMTFLVRAVEAITELPLLIDTANPEAMRAGVGVARGKVILNGFSMEPDKLERILPLAAEYDVDIIGYLLDAKGRPPAGADERLALAVELHRACVAAEVKQEHLIIDPVVAPLLWEDGRERNRAVLEVIRTLPEVLGHAVRTISGLSNLTAGARFSDQQMSMECAYAAMLAASGLDMLLLNMFHTETVRVARACDAFLSEKVFTWQTA
ncbi:MAG: dihydropteroate synthase [Deltaproteobacteria bacterium]|jgi:5-methyltetrahydrofolate corrinoid/iron sulfur protein methyltransferase